MIVSEVISPPDCHDDPTLHHGAWFLSARTRTTATRFTLNAKSSMAEPTPTSPHRKPVPRFTCPDILGDKQKAEGIRRPSNCTSRRRCNGP